ncbi:NifU family protein [Streptomyces thermodiastaticus]
MAAETAPAPVRLADADVEARLARIDDLLETLESAPGPTVRGAVEAVRLLTEVYGEALARVLEYADTPMRRRMAEDELLEHLLVLHAVHPDPVEVRAARAVERLRPAVRASGGDVELAAVDGEVARVRVRSGGGCGAGCGGGGADVAGAVREAVLAAAPELADVETVPEQPAGRAAPAFVPLEALARRGPDVLGVREAG